MDHPSERVDGNRVNDLILQRHIWNEIYYFPSKHLIFEVFKDNSPIDSWVQSNVISTIEIVGALYGEYEIFV